MSGRWKVAALAVARGAVFVGLTSLLFEVGLRVLPEAIPTHLLKRFEPGLRLEIAQRRHLPNESQTHLLVRDDGGPPIRLFDPHSRVPFFYEDTGESGEMVMDGLGFCNAPEDDSRRTKIALIAIGDSFTVCHPPSPRIAWPSALGRRLRLSAYNLARGGYGPYEYVQLLRAIGIAKQPRIVVMMLYEGNDLRDAVHHHAYLAARPEDRERVAERASLARFRVDPARSLRNPLGRSSYAYNLAVVACAYGSSELLDALEGGQNAHVNFRYRLEFEDAVVSMNVRNTDEDEVRSARAVAAGELDFAPLDGALESFAALAQAHHFRPVVAYAPSAHTAYAEFVRFEDPALAPVMRAFSGAQRAHVAALARALGLDFVDLTPALRRAAARDQEQRLLYFPINVHFTPAGHAVVAAALASALEPRAAAQRAGN